MSKLPTRLLLGLFALMGCGDPPPRTVLVTSEPRVVPPPPVQTQGAVAVTTGSSHSCALMRDGSAWCWGTNERFALGRSTELKYAPPGRVEAVGAVEAITAGWGHTCALQSGTVQCWGANGARQIAAAAPSPSKRAHPAAPAFDDFVQVEATSGVTCGLRETGEIWCWGAGSFRDRAPAPAAIGGTGGPHRIVQFDVDTALGCGRDGHGNVHCFRLGPDSNGTPAAVVPGLPPALQVATAQNFGCALASADHRVWCWGRDPARMPPRLVEGLDDVLEVAAGGSTACARKQDGTVWCWGSNAYGLLGFAPANGLGRHRPVRDKDLAGPPVRIPALTGATDIDVGTDHGCAVLAEGRVSCWGRADFGQVGVGMDARVSTRPASVVHVSAASAVAAGTVTNCALRVGGTVRCWSDPRKLGGTFEVSAINGADQLVLGNSGGCALMRGKPVCWGTPLKTRPKMRDPFRGQWVSGMPPLTHIAAHGLGHRCGVTAGGEVWCWGLRFAGGGSASLEPYGSEKVPGASQAVQLALTARHGCFRRTDGTVGCFVVSDRGGHASARAVVGPTDVVDIAAGAQHCALTARNELWCWGRDLKPQRRKVLPKTHLRQISLGRRHGCGVMADGGVWCWGQNEVGQLGRGRLGPLSPGRVEGLTGIVEVRANGQHTCARGADGKLFCWGAPDPAGRGLGAAAIHPVIVPIGP